MPVQFVIGRAGSGKTRHCVDAIAAAVRADPLGKPIYWIVPKQATFSAERLLLAELGAFCRARVVSFDSLGREVFAYAGGNAIPEVTPLGRQMVIGHLLRRLKPQLKFFASSARQPGLAAELDAAFAEFERSGKSSSELATLIDDIDLAKPVDVDHLSLLAKLRDIRLVYDAYAKYLGQDRLDQHQRLQQVLGCIDGCPPLRGATAYVDGFTAFADHERKLLAGLSHVCARVEIAMLLDPASPVIRDPHQLPDEESLFRPTELAYRKLWFALAEANVAVTAPVILDTPQRFVADDLRDVERRFDHPVGARPASPEFVGARPASPSGDAGVTPTAEGDAGVAPTVDRAVIEFIVAPDRAAEVNAVARGIRKLWRQGVRLREIAVLVRDVEPYHALIDASFREHRVAYFVDRRRSASHHPLLQFVRSLFQIIRYDWPNEPAIALMKTGLAGLSTDEADDVENYVERHHLRGVAWEADEPWAYRRRMTTGDDESATTGNPETVDALRRRVVDRIRPSASVLRINDALTVRDIATELFTTLDRFGVRETLARWADAAREHEPEQAAEHEQVWAEFVDLCEQMVDLLGDERVELADFVDVLESGLERFDLALTPPTVDQVLVGQVDRTRCPPGLRACFVLGLNESEFPCATRERSVLTEPERRELRNRAVEMSADRIEQLREEELLGYIAFTRASEQLFISRTRSNDDGRPVEPSRFWTQLRGMFPKSAVTEIPREAHGDVRFMETPREVVGALMKWARSDGRPLTPALSPEYGGEGVEASLYQWFATYPREDDAIGRMRSLAWPALGYMNESRLSSESAERLFGVPLEVSARQVETFATCPFKHFARYGLDLKTPAARGVSAMDLSQVYHKVLDIAVAEVLEKQASWEQLREVVTPAMIREYAQVVGQTLRGELMLSTARNKYLLGRVERTLGEVVAAQAEMMNRGQFRPAFTGVQFGEQGRLPALRVATPTGRAAVVRGNIDRVDLLPGGSHAAVFDYKMSSAPLSIGDVYHGLSLQLLTYLLVLQASGDELAGKPLTPVAAFYLPVLRRLGDVLHPSEAADPTTAAFHLRVKPRGVFDGEFLPAFDSSLERGKRSDVVNAMIKQDGTIGDMGRSDAADAEAFAGLLAFVRQRIGELADGIVNGNVDVAPYRIVRETPCPRCEYRSVCRFEPSINRYRNLEPIGRADVLARMSEGDARGE